MLKVSEIQAMGAADIKKQVSALRKELFELNLQKNTTSVEKPHLFKAKKKDIARLLMVLNTKEVRK